MGNFTLGKCKNGEWGNVAMEEMSHACVMAEMLVGELFCWGNNVVLRHDFATWVHYS